MASEEQPAQPAAKTRRGPFIMPDGRPLTAVLEQQQLRPHRSGGSSRRRPGQVHEPKEGWTKPLPRAAQQAGAMAASSDVQSEAEAAEMYALSRVGQRKQRRWLNDKLLRDMAGALTASEMASLFKPVPFGEQRVTLWERAAQPEHAVLWDLFRSLDMDKQTRVLQKWEAHVRELQAGPNPIHNPAVDAMAAWAGISWKARQAMKRSSPSHVHAIEAPILAFLQQESEPGAAEELVLAGLDDGFHRLIAHGLCEYHSLASHSRPLPDGSGKEVVVRRRAVAAGTAAGSSAATAAASGEAGEEAADAAGPAGRRPPLQIACSDLLHVLVDEAQPLTPQVLHHAYFSSSLLDSSSEAGDYHHHRQQQHHQDLDDDEQQEQEQLEDEQQQQQQQQRMDVSPSLQRMVASQTQL